MWKRAPLPMILMRLIAPAVTIALSIFSSILLSPQKSTPVRHRNAGFLTMPPNQHFDHIGDTTMLQFGGFPNGVFDARIDAEIQRSDFGSCHGMIVLLE